MLPIVDRLTQGERETVVVANEGEDYVHIDSTVRRHITRMRSNPRFEETGSGMYGSTEWAKFRIPAADWNPASGAKRAMSEQAKQASAERLAKARSAHGSVNDS